jgi:hypothetical protein
MMRRGEDVQEIEAEIVSLDLWREVMGPRPQPD